MGKQIKRGSEAQSKVIAGIIDAAETVQVTLGPSGRVCAINDMPMGVTLTRDGVTVLKSISYKDPELDMGAQLLKKAALLTESDCGDATSSTTILTKEMCIKGQKALNTGVNVNDMKAGMLKAQKWVSEYISKSAIKVDGDLDKIKMVATVSANNDPEMGDIIASCMETVGVNGCITADVAAGLDNTVDITSGMKLEKGWSSPHYVTNPADGTCVLENPYVLIVGEKISSMNQIVPVLKAMMESGQARPFLIVCDDIDENVNSTLIVNTLQGNLRCCVVKSLEYAEARKNLMQDIATYCGGIYLSPEMDKTVSEAGLESLGAAAKIVITKDSTIIYNGAGNQEEINERAELIKAHLQTKGISDYEKNKFEKRLANLCGGIAIIKVGGATEAEKMNRKATAIDAILASKSALEEGYLVGSGMTYFKAAQEIEKDVAFWKSLGTDEKEGARIVVSSLPVIMKTVVDNCGTDGNVVLAELKRCKKENWGFNAKTREYCNLLEAGILDSAKAVRCALEYSVSTASMALLIDASVVEEPVEEKK